MKSLHKTVLNISLISLVLVLFAATSVFAAFCCKDPATGEDKCWSTGTCCGGYWYVGCERDGNLYCDGDYYGCCQCVCTDNYNCEWESKPDVVCGGTQESCECVDCACQACHADEYLCEGTDLCGTGEGEDRMFHDYSCIGYTCVEDVSFDQTCRCDASDTDGGVVKAIRGTCTDYTGCSGGNCESTEFTDYCINETALREYYVDGDRCAYEDIRCVCNDGVCSCELESVSITPECEGGITEDCDEGENVRVDITYPSEECHRSLPTLYVQVDMADTGCTLCDDQPANEDLGCNDQCSYDAFCVACTSSPCTAYWTIPSILPECKNKVVSGGDASLRDACPCDGGVTLSSMAATGWFKFAEVMCYVDTDCDDGNPCTTDVCVNPGTSSSYCQNTDLPNGTSCGTNSICCETTGQSQCTIGECCTDAECPNGEVCSENNCYVTATINLYSGWNMVSIPYRNFIIRRTNCELEPKACPGCLIHYWDAEKQDWVVLPDFNDLTYDRGYWIYVPNLCFIDLFLEEPILASDLTTNYPGWNLIGSLPAETDVNDIQGSCAISDELLYYDAENQKWIETYIIQPYKSYWFYTDTVCQLS